MPHYENPLRDESSQEPAGEHGDTHQMWEQKLRELDTVKDNLGEGIDPGIKETVAVLQLFNIPTRQSCEGHLDHGVASPWVDLESPEARQCQLKALELSEKLQALDEGTDQYESLERDLAEVMHQRDRVMATEAKKLYPLLQEFYQGRDVPL